MSTELSAITLFPPDGHTSMVKRPVTVGKRMRATMRFREPPSPPPLLAYSCSFLRCRWRPLAHRSHSVQVLTRELETRRARTGRGRRAHSCFGWLLFESLIAILLLRRHAAVVTCLFPRLARASSQHTTCQRRTDKKSDNQASEKERVRVRVREAGAEQGRKE